jgi:histidyl-tRNA synthetase
MKRADRLRARHTLIVGGDELARGEVTVRDMETGEQRPVKRADAVADVRRSANPNPGTAEPRNLGTHDV